MKALPWTFYDRDTARVARDLIGKVLVHREGDFHLARRIVETEAYLGMVDPSSHLAKGFTRRTRTTWGQPGRAYVFTIRGHFCLNAITLSDWPYGCVLLRGVDSIIGPGRLTKAFQIDADHNGKNLTRDCLQIVSDPDDVNLRIGQTTRVGISKAVDMPLRFYDEDRVNI